MAEVPDPGNRTSHAPAMFISIISFIGLISLHNLRRQQKVMRGTDKRNPPLLRAAVQIPLAPEVLRPLGSVCDRSPGKSREHCGVEADGEE
ncbi:hypothetical protein NHX12_029914 [Muraenolepis orangiensis]|uniref:Uncharacterized protein n=1 Tax=Muraenolepis orangiensis TaxID=630683 RepID=A0A9Q0IL81_9TELE|nr:hypothetical protein NHX12_029914 [Muraenolepis orangiensis]